MQIDQDAYLLLEGCIGEEEDPDLRVGTPFGAAEDDHVVGGAGRRSAAEN